MQSRATAYVATVLERWTLAHDGQLPIPRLDSNLKGLVLRFAPVKSAHTRVLDDFIDKSPDHTVHHCM